MTSSEMYTEIILDYYRNPKNFGVLENPSASARDTNPLCGDIIEMQFVVKNGLITDVRYNGKGCAISQASASMLTEIVKGKSVKESIQFDKSEIVDLLGIQISPVRLKCALLCMKVMKLALYNYLGEDYSAEK